MDYSTTPHPTNPLCTKISTPTYYKKKKMHKYIYTHFLSCMVIIVGYHYLKRLQDSHTHKPSKCSNNQQIRKSCHVQVYDF